LLFGNSYHHLSYFGKGYLFYLFLLLQIMLFNTVHM